MKKDIYYIDINENDQSGMGAISLVSHPAVETEFLCFEEQTKSISFSANEDKRVVTGVAIRADKPIYRRDGEYEYYVVFTKDVIRKLINKYAKNGLFNSVNIEHDSYSFVKSAYMIESYIVDHSRGIVPSEFSDIEDGSWIVSYYIEDDQLWNVLKNTDALNGFSIEGLFHLEKSENDPFEEFIDEILESN